jgi:hypothetical protein
MLGKHRCGMDKIVAVAIIQREDGNRLGIV